MNRISGRLLIIGLCAVALSTAVSPLLLKHSAQRRSDEAWSSRQYGTVTPDVSRTEPQHAASTPPDDEKSARQQALIDELTRTGRAAASRQSESGIDSDSASEPRRSQVDKKDSARSAPVTSPARKKPAERTRKQNAQSSPVGETKQSEARVAPAAVQSESVQTGPSSAPTSRDESAADSQDQTPPRASDTVNLPTEKNAQSSGDVKAETSVPPSTKSRKDVQDELRRARSNGSLPRFGNPDPYGPGGSPSTSSNE
ncbi:hypothetical protein AWB76_06604 [Caballeronia temeraria]|uniref:Uncharacterized protein n=1 Tax=Caballeronia temeraria TaxID=1777137 RepID=A0A158D8F3_9BURK|nr:hypothetical protein AWB76_06604 [Caballeronia temeraria]